MSGISLRHFRDRRCWEFEIFEPFPELVHAVFLRSGGVSEGPYTSLNVSYSVGDLPERVEENRRRICLDKGYRALYAVHQVHGVDIVEATSSILAADGLMTQEVGVGLLIQHADCQAMIIYDPCHQAVANVHAGWRGNVQNIYKAAVEKMQERYGSCPSDMRVAISPSLGPCCAEFIHYETEIPSSLWQFQVRPTYFDLGAMARYQLEQAGVLREHIQIAPICTCCHPEDYFSYRRDKITGRHATVVGLYRK